MTNSKPAVNVPNNPKISMKKRIDRALVPKSSYYKVSFIPMEYTTAEGKPYRPNHAQRYEMYKDFTIVCTEISEQEEYGIVKVAINDDVIKKYKRAMIEAERNGIKLPWHNVDRRDNYPPFKMRIKKLERLPKHLKEIRHMWLCDNSISILPMYSNFAIACREKILALESGTDEFQIDINNTKWDLKLVKETPFIYLVEDTQLHALR